MPYVNLAAALALAIKLAPKQTSDRLKAFAVREEVDLTKVPGYTRE